MSFLDELNDLPRPRSLVEVALFSTEAGAAKTRLRLLSGYECGRKLEQPEERLGLGLDILLVATDAARRNASEAKLYRSVRGGMNLVEAVSDRLFDANDHPKPEIKKLLADTCRHYWLRNVFGREDTQEWFGSIKIQFGFTKKGFVENLPEWLMGYRRPTTVSLLLDDQRLASRSFHSLWNALLDYRNRLSNMPEAHLRQIISRCPWTLPEWADELLVAARKKPHLSPSTSHGGPEGEGARTCLSEPRLRVGAHLVDARWEIVLEGLADSELTDKSYRVSVSCGRASPQEVFLRQQEAGTYSNLDSVFEIPAAQASDGRVSAVLFDSQGRQVAAQDVQMFDPDHDVVAFRQGGCFDGDFLKRGPVAGVLYTLLLRDDLTLAPASAECAVLGNTGYRIVRYSMVAGQTLRILFNDGDELWSSLTRTVRNRQPLPPGITPLLELWPAELSQMHDSTVQTLSLKLSGLGSAEARSARWRSHGLTIIARDEPILGGIPKHEALIAGRVAVSLALGLNGKTYRTVVEWEPTAHGILEEGRGKAAFARHLSKRTYKELESGRYWIFPPARPWPREDDPPWCLFEGDRFAGTVRAGSPHRFHNLGAYGSSVTLRPDRFNTANAQSKLIGELADTGLFFLDDADPLPNSDGKLACWASPEIGECHRLYYGAMHEAVISEAATERLVIADGEALFDPFPSCPCDYLVLTYEGARLAAWWRAPKNNASWSSNLANIGDDEAAKRAAFTMRWARLPILGISHFTDVSAFFRRFPHVVLREWLGSVKQHDDGRKNERENTDAWRDAVRTLIEGVQVIHAGLTPDERHKLLTCVAREPVGDPVAGLLDTLNEVGRCDPILMGRILNLWLTSDPPPPPLLRRQVRTLLVQSLDEPRLHLELESFTGCDEYFLKAVLDAGVSSVMNPTLDAIKTANLKCSLTVPPFRELLFLRIVNAQLHPGIG